MAFKTLNFYAYGLKSDTTIMLTFGPPKSGELFPVAWKVITFAAGEHAQASVTYTARLAFGHAQTSSGNLVHAGTWVEVTCGDSTDFSGSPGKFGPVVHGTTKLITCKNNTNQRVDLSVGVVQGEKIRQHYEPTLLWSNVESGSSISVQFTPILTAYVARDYQATEILRGAVEEAVIWSRNLNELNETTDWDILEDDASGAFTIEPAKL